VAHEHTPLPGCDRKYDGVGNTFERYVFGTLEIDGGNSAAYTAHDCVLQVSVSLKPELHAGLASSRFFASSIRLWSSGSTG
jgi:hypothetical protein